MENTFLNTNYSTNYEKKSIIISSSTTTHSQTDFNIEFVEPLRIDQKVDIYIDSFTTQNIFKNSHDSSGNTMGFIINIDKFNFSNTSSNNSFINNRIFIPNEEKTNNTSSSIHKGKKMNYICTQEPIVIRNLSMKITQLDGISSIFSSNDGSFIIELLLVKI